MAHKDVLIAGASGLVGYAAVKHFGERAIALSRRPPADLHGAMPMSVDLTDPAACRTASSAWTHVTHLVYAALFELPGLVDGWRDDRQIHTNDAMLRNLLEALISVAPNLRHVTLLQGTKAYGVHVRPMRVPAREGRSEMREQPNFYWQQEDYLRSRQIGQNWHWTILRPVLIVGEAIIDEYQYVTSLGKPSKETMLATQFQSREIFAGGAVAAANHVASFCGKVDLLTC